MSEPLVPVPRRVRPWQPHPALLLVSTARAFAAAHWDDVRQGQDEEGEYGDEVDASADPAARSFAQSTLTHDPNDFRPWQARPFNKPLSELSRQALQRFDAELAAENAIVHSDDLDDALVMHSPGRDARVYRADPMLGHAAFKPDIYEFDDDLDDAPAQTQADDEEAAFANPLDDALLEEAGSEVAADAAEDAAEDGHEEALADAYDGDAAEEDAPENDATEGDASNDDATMAAAPEGDNEASEAAAEVESEVELEAAADEAPDDATDVIDVSGDLADLQAAATADDPSAPTQEASATADLSAEPEPTTEPTPEPTTETAWAESDVAQDDVIAAPSLAETEAEAANAIADAVNAASTTLGIDEHELARREAEQYQLGLTEGERIAHERMSQEIAAQRTVLESVTQQLHALLQSPQQFFEPLKRLAVHVAEQVVLGELQTSSQTIERVIARCLDELNHPVQGMVVIELHPQDKARLLETAPELVRGMRIDANETMTPGSVRLFANDAIVEDLVTQRLHALVQGLHLDDQAWQSHSLLQQPQWSAPKDMQPTHASPQAPAIADSSESDDVHP